MNFDKISEDISSKLSHIEYYSHVFSEKTVKAITIVSHNKTKVFVHLFQKVAVSKGGALVAVRRLRNSLSSQEIRKGRKTIRWIVFLGKPY